MESMCTRCARLTHASRSAVSRGTILPLRSFSTSRAILAQGMFDESRPRSELTICSTDDPSNNSVASAGKSMANAMGGKSQESQGPSAPARRPLIRRTDAAIPQRPLIRRTTGDTSTPNPVLRRTASPQGTQGTQGAQGAQTGQRGPLLRRTVPQAGAGAGTGAGAGQFLRRTGAQQGGQLLQRSRSPNGAPGRSGASGRGGRPQGQRSQGPKVDKRRRRSAREGEEDEDNSAGLEKDMDEFIAKHVDRPPNPTEPLPYNPTKMTLDDLRSDWPNTAMTTSGMTESVIQKIEWLARRLPHGYQYPEQIAEHYLKGNLTRFESEEEKQLVLKIAADMSAKTKQESDEGTLHKHETPRFQIVEDPAFTSMTDKSSDKDYLLHSGVKGDYGELEKQRYPFMQNAARTLNNNGSYGPAQMQRVLDRVQALIPQGRTPAAQQVKKA